MKLLTPKEVSLILKCSARHVLQMAEKGILDAIVVNNSEKKVYYRIPQTALDDFINRQLIKIKPSKAGSHV